MRAFRKDSDPPLALPPMRPAYSVPAGHRPAPLPSSSAIFTHTDTNSMYPFIMIASRAMKGVPQIFLGSEIGLFAPPLERRFGLMHCRVRPPKRLLYPILPSIIASKLMFALCRTCAQTQHQGTCKCEEWERDLTGVWMTCELQYAVANGYVIVAEFELFQYEESFPSGPGGLFHPLISTLLLEKIYASEPPSGDGEMERLVEDYASLGIRVESGRFRPDASARLLAKTAVNSAWGKLALNLSHTSSKFVSSLPDYYAIENNQRNQIKVLFPLPSRLLARNLKWVVECSRHAWWESSPC